MRIPASRILTIGIYAAIFVVVLAIGFRYWSSGQVIANLDDAQMGQYMGPANAEITVVEFLDYRCSYCRELYGTMKEVAEKNPDVKVVFRHLIGFGPPSLFEADFALAAGMQGRFLDAHDLLMQRETPLTEGTLKQASDSLGLDYGRLVADMSGPEIGDVLIQNVNAAEALGINSTPTLIINGEVLNPQQLGYLPKYEDINALIEKARK